jgi:hypothetical protein
MAKEKGLIRLWPISDVDDLAVHRRRNVVKAILVAEIVFCFLEPSVAKVALLEHSAPMP